MNAVRKNDLPERVGKKWEPEEEIYVLKRISQGANYMTIASECKRKIGGISAHLREMACRFIKDGKTMEEVVQITGLLETEIADSIAIRERSEKLKVERQSRPKEEIPKLKQTFLPFLVEPQKTSNPEFMTILVEIRDLLKQLVKDKDGSD